MSQHFQDTDNSAHPHAGLDPVEAPHVPGSGTLPEGLREQPVRTFDNTTLPGAVERGHLVTPESPAPLDSRGAEKKRKKGLLIGVGAGAAGLALAAGALIGVNAAGQAPNTEPTAAAPADPSETPTDVEPTPASPEAGTEVSAQAYEISGDLSAADAVMVFVNDRLSAWTMAGATQETVDDYLASGGRTSYFDEVAGENSLVIANALFVPGWRDDDALAHYVDWETAGNANSLKLWTLTRESGLPQDREPYVRSVAVNSVQVVSNEPDTARFAVIATEHDNADQNSVGVGERISQPEPLDGHSVTGDITLQRVDGTWKVAAISWAAYE